MDSSTLGSGTNRVSIGEDAMTRRALPTRRANVLVGDLKEFWRRYRKSRTAVTGLAMVFLFAVIALIAAFISPYDPLKVGVGPPLTKPSARHVMGTDDLGRDVYSGVVWGARISMLVGFLAAITSAIIGCYIGAISGYYGGFIDDLLMRITELFMVIPRLFLALVMVALFGSGLWNVIFVIGVLSWPPIARVVRAEFLSLKEREFVEAVRALGAGNLTIIFGEILPNAFPSLIVSSSLQVGSAILIEAGLSFLGLGDPNTISWGMMLSNAQRFLREAWWMVTFPGGVLLLTVLALNFVGDGLNDALNPRLKER